MLHQNIPSNIGKTNVDTERSAVGSLVEFLDERLPQFPQFFKKQTTTKKIEAEKKISRELCLFLNDIKNPNRISLFHFYPEWDYEKSHRSSDFGVIDVRTYTDSKPTEAFFVIEAKRLPTPLTGREREYVEGDLGGIERYKRGHHGNGLLVSGMIGYIQDKNNCNHWYQEINKWIDNLIKTNTASDIFWDNTDLLKKSKDLTITSKYTSKNTRIVGKKQDFINLYHYLIELN